MKKRILIVAERGMEQLGGIQKGIKFSTIALSDSYDFDLVVFEDKVEEYKKEFPHFKNIFCCDIDFKKIKNEKIKRIFKRFFAPITIYSFFMKLTKENKYDVVHCHDFSKGCWALCAAKKHGVKKRIIHSHNPLTNDPKGWFARLYEKFSLKLALKNTTVRVGCSEVSVSAYTKLGYDSVIINNDVELSRFYQKPKQLSPDGTVTFINVARFTFQKNHPMIVEIFSEINKLMPNSRLVLVGWGVDKEKIENKVKDMGLDSVVTFLPGNSDIPEEFSKAQYKLLPSYYEGMPHVLIEAQASEVFCFVSDTVTKLSDIGLCEFLPLTDTPKQWAEHIVDFINSGKRDEYSLNVEKMNEFSIDVIKEHYRAVYES